MSTKSIKLAPLVEPAGELSQNEIERYSRHLIIPEVGLVGQRRIKNAKVLIIGAGGLGQFAIQFMKKLANVELTVLDMSDDKLAAAKELGADHALKQLPNGVKYDAIIDFVGAKPTMEAAAGAVNRQGILVVVGLAGGRLEFGVGVIPSEAVLTTSIWGSLEELKELLEFVRTQGVEHLVETMPLDDAQEALDRLRRGEIRGRVVLTVA